ncbi:MAG: hypothetical protein CMJ47_08745 [Planctomyces sp.]|nr:hypothetical protein [Planctomyces sp.]
MCSTVIRQAMEQARWVIFHELESLTEDERDSIIEQIGHIRGEFREILTGFTECFSPEMVPGLEEMNLDLLLDLHAMLIWVWGVVWTGLQEEQSKSLFLIWEHLQHYLSAELAIRLTE